MNSKPCVVKTDHLSEEGEIAVHPDAIKAHTGERRLLMVITSHTAMNY